MAAIRAGEDQIPGMLVVELIDFRSTSWPGRLTPATPMQSIPRVRAVAHHGDRWQSEHAVLSDGWHHIRIDLEQGSLASGKPAVLEYRLRGVASAEPKILPLLRLLDLVRDRRFSISLYPPYRRVDR